MRRHIFFFIALATLVGLSTACSLFGQAKAPATPGATRVPASSPSTGEGDGKAELYLLVIEAENALLRGNLDRARKIYAAVAKIDQNNPELHYSLSQLYIKAGDLDRALHHADRAYQIQPAKTHYAVALAGLHAAKGEIDQAIAIYGRIAETSPENEEIALVFSSLLMVKKEFAPARDVLLRMLTHHPNSARGVYELARTALLEDNCEAAKPDLAEVLAIDPKFYEAHIALGFCARKEKDDKAAIEHYEQALEINPDNARLRMDLVEMYLRNNDPEAANRQNEKLRLFQIDEKDIRVNRGLILYHQARFEEAVTEFNLVLSGDPKNGFAQYYLALCQTRMGKLEEAMESYSDIDRESSFFLDGLIAQGALLRRLGKLGPAEELLRDAQELAPGDPYLLRTLAVVIADAGRVDEAIKMMNEARALMPQDEALVYSLANIYERAGQWEKGIRLMEEVLEKNPDNTDALNFIGYTLVEHDKDLERAEGLLKKAVELRPKDGFIKDSYGWLLFKKGKYRQALPLLRDSHHLVPDEPVIAEHLGDCYRALKDLENALLYYNRALKLHPEKKVKESLLQKVKDIE